MMARFVAAGDTDAQVNLLATFACTAFLSDRLDPALEYLRAREELMPGTDGFRSRSSALFLPATIELARSGPAAARAAIDRARRLSAERQAEWVDPFLGFAAGGIALAAGDWDDSVAELDSALERAEETGTGWISLPVGMRSYIDAHRGSTGQARARLESFRHRGLPLQFALLAVLGFTLGKGDDSWLATWGGAGVGIVLGAIILALVPVMPFTEQFARESTPQAYWSSPTFKRINRVLSAAWGLAIFAVGASRVAAAAVGQHTASHRLPELLLSLAVPLAIVVYMLKFSKSYPDRVAQHAA